jgi:hypothetical protein
MRSNSTLDEKKTFDELFKDIGIDISREELDGYLMDRESRQMENAKPRVEKSA